MTNTERVQKILHELEKNHLNLYHDISKDEVAEHIARIQNLDGLSEMEFDYEMLKLFALFKDGHTNYKVGYEALDRKIIYNYGVFYIKMGKKYEKISKFGKISPKRLYKLLAEMTSYETESWLNHKINWHLDNGVIFKMLGIMKGEKMTLTLENGERVEVKTTEYKKEKKLLYEYQILDGILYIRYHACQEDSDYPFAKFTRDIEREIEQKGITSYILDVRGNSGGDSEILNPLQELMKERKLKGVMLIDDGVFSSGRFAVARFKKDCGVTLIGEPTGGAAKSYGYNNHHEVDGKTFTSSKKLWDFSDVFGYTGAIQPDIFVPRTIDDIASGKDNQLAAALEFLREKVVEK